MTSIDAVASGDEFYVNDVSGATNADKIRKASAAQVATFVNSTYGSAVSGMTAASASDGTELHYVVQGGADRKMTGAQIATYAASVNISDTAYDATSWNGVTGVAPSKNAVRDQIETVIASIPTASDTAYASSWNGVTTIPPSKNAVYDKFETLVPTPVTAAWVTSTDMSSGLTASSNSATNTLYYVPVWIPARRTISDLGIFIMANQAGNMALAVYANSATNTPSGAALAATGNIATNPGANSAVSADITGANVTLDPGLYWFAYWFDVASVTVGCQSSGGVSCLVGSTTLNDVFGNTSMNYVYTSAETYNSAAWPNATSETLTLVPRSSSVRAAIFAMKVV